MSSQRFTLIDPVLIDQVERFATRAAILDISIVLAIEIFPSSPITTSECIEKHEVRKKSGTSVREREKNRII